MNNIQTYQAELDRIVKNPTFDVITIAGYRYSVTVKEVMGWFKSKWFWAFLIISNIIMVFILPHNRIYNLSMSERWIFWPLNTIGYLIIYISCIHLGARWCSKQAGRTYYTPIGMAIATMICTIGSAFLIGYMHDSPADLGVFKWMEVIFNLLWASVFEAVHYAFILPRLRKRQSGGKHQWEDFD